MSKPKQLYWIGERDANGHPLEYFGGLAGVRDPIPARGLTPEETEALTEAQWACIDSPTGKRLYRRTEPDRQPSSIVENDPARSSTENQPDATNAPDADA